MRARPWRLSIKPRTVFWQGVTAGFLAVIHISPVVALAHGTSTRDWAALAITYPIASFGCTAGLHRYFAHRSFQTSRLFQFMMGLMAAAAFGDPIAFSARHRIHHAASDTDNDVHSPNQGFLYCWFGTLLDYGMSDEDALRWVPDLAVQQEIVWLHRLFFVPGVLTAAAIWLTGGFTMFAIGYCGACLAIVHAGSAVNYFGHKRWTRRYETADNSANNPLVALVSLGEGWHNNHHRYPAACRAGFFWWEVDVLYYEIKLLSALGVVWGLNEVPDRVRHDVIRFRNACVVPPQSDA
jgi:stearoyl-CoA desaturase (Delta-9 desaturase)